MRIAETPRALCIWKFIRVLLALTFLSPVFISPAVAQKQPGNPSNPGSAGTSASQPAGMSYLLGDLPTEMPQKDKQITIICYELKEGASAAQPFFLELADPGGDRECAKLDPRHTRPLFAGDKLVIRIHALLSDTTNFKSLTINVTTQQGTPINAAPIRPSMSATGATASAGGAAAAPKMNTLSMIINLAPAKRPSDVKYYLTWPVQMQGDTVPTVTITGMYAPSLTWQSKTPYLAGNVVLADPDNHHLYSAVEGGVSGVVQPAFPTSASAKIVDGTIVWQESGIVNARNWQANYPYQKGDVVWASPDNGHAYTALKSGSSGPMPPTFAITASSSNPSEITDNSVSWQDSGSSSGLTVGSQNEQSVNLLNLTLPQAHTLYYYNLASGVVASTVEPPTFVFQQTAGSTTNTPKRIGGDPLVDPVLMFMAYPVPMDAERPWHPRDLIPGITFGLSLSSPASNFYFGGSSEIRRNVQVVYGFNIARISKLAPAGTVSTSTSTPATVQYWGKGAFIGITYNISSFIQSLFGGGGKSGGS